MSDTPSSSTPSTENRPRRCRHRGHKFLFALLLVAAVTAGIGYATHSHADRWHGGGPGWGPGWGGRDCPASKSGIETPLTQETVKNIIDRRLARWGNDNLTAGPINETDTVITGTVVTKKEGALVQSFVFDKLTGRPISVK